MSVNIMLVLKISVRMKLAILKLARMEAEGREEWRCFVAFLLLLLPFVAFLLLLHHGSITPSWPSAAILSWNNYSQVFKRKISSYQKCLNMSVVIIYLIHCKLPIQRDCFCQFPEPCPKYLNGLSTESPPHCRSFHSELKGSEILQMYKIRTESNCKDFARQWTILIGWAVFCSKAQCPCCWLGVALNRARSNLFQIVHLTK